jgi:YD repeat-containing protein
VYTRSFDSEGRLKTHRVGSDTRTLTYDAAGNPANDGATTFTWNAAGKLATTINNAKTHTYKTNALDQRVSKNGPLSSKFFFFYDLAGQLIGEYRDNSSTATPADDWLVRQETIWLEDIPVAVIRKPPPPARSWFTSSTPTISIRRESS